MSHKNRKLQRIKNYDYRSNGAYFVTICTKGREYYFGKIENGKMVLSKIGKVTEICWLHIPNHFPDSELDLFVILPNHIHGIIVIKNELSLVGNENFRSLPNGDLPSKRIKDKYGGVWCGAQSRSLSSIIRGFKIGVTKWCRQNDFSNFLWQKSFHDHIIRNEKELEKIRKYIVNNPKNWDQDCFSSMDKRL